MSSVWTQAAEVIRSRPRYRQLENGPVRLQGTPIPVGAWLSLLRGADQAKPSLVITPGESDALAWVEAAKLFSEDPQEVVYFPSPSLTPYQESETSLQVRSQESVALHEIFQASCPTVVCTPRALFRPIPSRRQFEAASHRIEVGAELEVYEMLDALVRYGYRRTELVAEPGTFAVRGGVVDLYPPGCEDPVRVDLFGDVVETLRTFDLASQRSGESIGSVSVLPMSLFEASNERSASLAQRLLDLGVEESGEAAERLEQLRLGEGFPGWENYLPALEKQRSGLGDLEELADHQLILLDPQRLFQEAEHHQEILEDEFDSRRAEGKLAVASGDLLLPLSSVVELLSRPDVWIGMPPSEWPGPGVGDARETVDLGASETDQLLGQLPRLQREVEIAHARGDRVVFVAPRGNDERLQELLEQRGIEISSRTVVVEGELRRGFRFPDSGLSVWSEMQLFPTRVPQRKRRSRLRPFLSGLRDLKVGEYVVHEDHGIGQFAGMRTLAETSGGEVAMETLPATLADLKPNAGSSSEVMEIVYADGRTLLLPLHRIDQIQRYSGVEGLAPKLDKLGGTSWSRKKSRVKKGLQKLAVDLLQLYAERKLAQAPVVREDSDGQSAFELAFEHTETEDQLVAIQEIKEDLESGRPMDRLLCGDVGFGKTEVAMRAAFKMVDNGFQVAVLAPTTILAAQHLRTFRKRFAETAVSIDMVSRFRTAAESRRILQAARDGKLDIVIGTHRLLSKDVSFANLGLLIVDEEQRFGVAHKEKLKEMRRAMHVLSLSATPVPRTLQMSLAGVRDLSTIESPPKDRMAVETQVVPFSGQLIRDAIEFEIERGGQIYFVHNRVEDIEQISSFLHELVPGLRMTVGHGQLEEKVLSERMQAFDEGEYDLLLATTIIENGIDIPNVNTMIVHHAERYGLAQLYQLRGRVGRSDQLAFCYLTVPGDRVLTEVARQRLRAIEEFTELGAGFRVAARDLEIRGAGDLLGAEQSGHISDLGIETYLKMLEETVQQLQGQEVDTPVSVQLDLPLRMSIPEDYVRDVNLRMDLYRRLATGDGAAADIVLEMRERFGPPPEEVRALARAADLKRLAEELRVQSIIAGGGNLAMQMRRDARIDVERLIELVAERGNATFTPSGLLTLSGVPGPESLSVAAATLERIRSPEEVPDGVTP